MRLDSKGKIYRIYGVLSMLLANKNNVERLTYSKVMEELEIRSRNTVSECIYIIRNVLGVPVKTSGGEYGGIWVPKEWKPNGGNLDAIEISVLTKLIPYCETEDDRKVLMGIINKNMF